MKLNRQSNIYTVVYIIIMVVVVGAALAYTSMALSERQGENERADKMRQILASIHVVPAAGEKPAEVFDWYIAEQKVLDASGQVVDGENAFDIDVAQQSKLPSDKRLLPLFVADVDGATKYIIPMSGTGLWGPIWGYISIDADGTTVYGAYFAHKGETPGLGAEIDKPQFCNSFDGKHVIKDGVFQPISVVKPGMRPTGNEDYVDGISGGTITSKGVSAMLDNCLVPYRAFLSAVNREKN
ncbi:MAG: NADH:ubiquinone reductase (Na(+)-transporting) subunit C [Candidatus Amulumruptor caecigallinarius]|uniref:Na(+)-translocating NADH-quinone reductase subunit C n=1 Tax=Candidatus Amulumruptor caecigallinarius TaxID=2109911 RepID=A0A4Q0U8Z0_9BACT|nr:MAG: NADH:ubiquinone reductase (Na(+)-transporting) subunit C [Candidatus Amulumruptor caecigallinarius]HJE38701.1 NADH:ubiquinone reductase (Na(+)-transporting) subunit C [Candidatus Amulumruptor caecigallinarius]